MSSILFLDRGHCTPKPPPQLRAWSHSPIKLAHCSEKRSLISILITKVSYPLNHVSETVQKFEMLTYRSVQLCLYLSSKHFGGIKAIFSAH